MASRIGQAARRFSRGLVRRMGLRPELELKAMLPGAEFERELERQVLLAVRSGAPCFLLRFFLASGFPGEREAAMESLGEAVRARMRLSDVAGRWADPEDSIALILRGARPEGAAVVASAVSGDFKRRMRRACDCTAPEHFLCSETRPLLQMRENLSRDRRGR